MTKEARMMKSETPAMPFAAQIVVRASGIVIRHSVDIRH
jgi:hypothetical protein